MFLQLGCWMGRQGIHHDDKEQTQPVWDRHCSQLSTSLSRLVLLFCSFFTCKGCFKMLFRLSGFIFTQQFTAYIYFLFLFIVFCRSGTLLSLGKWCHVIFCNSFLRATQTRTLNQMCFSLSCNFQGKTVVLCSGLLFMSIVNKYKEIKCVIGYKHCCYGLCFVIVMVFINNSVLLS